MERKLLHSFLMPVLERLYVNRNSEELIDITDCLPTEENKFHAIIRDLLQSNFIVIRDDTTLDIVNQESTPKILGKILFEGEVYYEAFKSN